MIFDLIVVILQIQNNLCYLDHAMFDELFNNGSREQPVFDLHDFDELQLGQVKQKKVNIKEVVNIIVGKI